MHQRITLVGNLGNDPEMRYLPDGRPVTNFSMATNSKWNNKQTGEPGQETVWWRISVFGPQAEACNQYLNKGRQVLVEGRMRPDPGTGNPRIWTRQDGTPAASYEVTGFNVRFLSGRDDNDAAPQQRGYVEKQGQAHEPDEAEGIPF